jgi:vacuolar-type H+-ATPase subunit H
MQDILAEVIKVEKEIQARLEAEGEKARQWVEQVKREMEEKALRAEEGFRELLENRIQEARAEADRKASEILNDANSKAEKIENLSDETLKSLITRHISRVLPGFNHDSQDVKG